MGIGKAFASFKQTINDTTATLRGVFWIGAIVMIIGLVIVQWLSTLNTGQWILLGILLLFLFLIAATYYIDWRNKKDIENIPELLAKLDRLTMDYIERAPLNSDKPEALLDDLAQLMKITNINDLKTAMKDKRKRGIEIELQKINERYTSYLQPKGKGKDQEILSNLLMIAGTLDDYKVGLASITDTFEYDNLYYRVRSLQKQVHVVEINMKINEYFQWAQGLYSMLLSMKPIFNMGEMKELIPVRTRASNNLLKNMVESQTAILISAVRESINKAERTV